MPSTLRIAAIDIGSNAVRMSLAQAGEQGLQLLRYDREPIRLGKDVFGVGQISERSVTRLIRALKRFKTQLEKDKVKAYRAVATSALREAENRDVVLERATRESGIDIQLIHGEEEARLVYLAVARQLPVEDRMTALIDVGGGSVEVALVEYGQLLAAETFKMGTVRLLHRLRDEHTSVEDFSQLVREYSGFSANWLRTQLGARKVELLAGTGGNVEALGDLRKRLLGKETDSMLSRDELEALVRRLEGMSYLDRIQKLELRPDRADVIVPAAIVLQELMVALDVEMLMVPRVGLKDGILLDLMDEQFSDSPHRGQRQQALRSALLLGRRFRFDEGHGQKVADLALQLFDQTRELHKLDDSARHLLEVAGLLHDVGKVVNNSGHHKHSWYLIRATTLIGLSESQRAVAACIARYHRKSLPTLRHDFFRELSPADRGRVVVLSALLRMAEALDAEHRGRVSSIRVNRRKGGLWVELQGEGDMLLETWASKNKLVPLEKALGTRIRVKVEAAPTRNGLLQTVETR